MNILRMKNVFAGTFGKGVDVDWHFVHFWKTGIWFWNLGGKKLRLGNATSRFLNYKYVI